MADAIKKPVKGRAYNVPVVMQLEALECGAACLDMILAYYGKWIPLEEVREKCGVSRDGSNALNMLKAARAYGMKASGYRYETESLKEDGAFPCIIHWNFNHFVVLNGFKAGKAYINDPARGEVAVPMKTFDVAFTGICIMLEPGEDFEKGGRRKSMWAFAKKRLKGTGAAVAFTALTAIIAALMGVIDPAFSRVFMDELLSGKNPAWITPFLIMLAAFNIIRIIVSALESVYSLRINGKMAAVGSATYMWKVLSMPLGFFSQRMAGDIQARQSSNASIASTLIDTFAPLVLNTGMMVFYLVVMLRHSVLLTLVGLCSLTVNALVSSLISKKRVNITRVSMRDGALLSSATVAGISMIETIKASGAEEGYFKKWAGHQAAVNTQKIKAQKLNQYLGMIPGFVSTLANDAVLVLGVWLTMQGEFSKGAIMAFQGFLSSFMSPALTLVSAGQTLQEMRASMERVEDVMEHPEDSLMSEHPENTNQKKLSGSVEVKNLVFGYSPLATPVIKDFSMSITPGKSVAIVGGSGCGKSTVSKLLSGLYAPWEGEILYDGKPISQIDKSVFKGSVAVVDQDIILFEDTIAANIKMWDESIEDFEMILACRDAQIHDDIMARKGGYNSRLTEGGKDLSGGQRQRIEIARVLALDPTLIILDEATSALDARTEYGVINAIKDRGISCVVIAHRLSTIRSCDEIIVLNKGEIAGRGTHEQLLNSCKLYSDLVSAE